MNSLKYFLFLLIECCVFLSFGRTITGKVINESSESLPMVNIEVDGETFLQSSLSGAFSIELDDDAHQIQFSYLGHEDKVIHIEKGSIDIELGNIVLNEGSELLNEVHISSNKFKQKVEESSVSIEVLKPEFIKSNGVTNIENAVDKTPGVHVADGQANIRGGSGFSYGAGSRVLVLLDGLPLISADAGDVKWDALPLENLDQIEVLKGASSALYGSSALNGVINVKTKWAADSAKTEFRLYNAVYDDPRNTNGIWWDKNPQGRGVNLYHSRKIKGNDMVISGNYHNDQGYRKGETDERLRLTFKTRINTKIDGFNWGINGNILDLQGGQIFIWDDADSGMYMARNDSVNNFHNKRINLDPFINYLDKKGNAHQFKGRFFNVNNQNDNGQNTNASTYYSEYNFQKSLKNWLITSGAVYQYFDVSSPIYSDHNMQNAAGFVQGDFKKNKWVISTGLRYEGFKTDQGSFNFQPNFRFGSNYKLAKATYLRASIGQAYRTPSIAERFINTSIPGLFFIPNPELKSESGWTAELGFKQGLKLGKWKGMFDVAGFIQEYENMIEFAFDSLQIVDLFAGDISLGFTGTNVDQSRITGIETSIMGQGKIGPVKTSILAGYTFLNPINLGVDISDSTYIEGDEILKYRFNHLFKANLQLEWKSFGLGLAYRFNSQINNVDEVFVGQLFGVDLIPGVIDFRAANQHGNDILDVNASYDIKGVKLSFIIKNALNEEYTSRPAFPQAPRTYMFQLNYSF